MWLRVVSAYYGYVARPLFFWTLVAVTVFISVLFAFYRETALSSIIRRKQPFVFLVTVLWSVHFLIGYLTILNLFAFEHFDVLHLSHSEEVNKYFTLLRTCAEMGSVSSVCVIVSTVLMLRINLTPFSK